MKNYNIQGLNNNYNYEINDIKNIVNKYGSNKIIDIIINIKKDTNILKFCKINEILITEFMIINNFRKIYNKEAENILKDINNRKNDILFINNILNDLIKEN